jgi:hypothetical protein
MKKIITVFILLFAQCIFSQQVSTTINDFFLPGSQPNQSGSFNTMPGNCNCHAGYDQNVEPMYTWQGSMMAQSQRDPLYLAALTIANQDAANSGDLCIRCHSPRGWLSGRSEPTDGSLLDANDREGIYCDFCHRAVKPTQIGINPYPNDAEYISSTYSADQTYLAKLTLTNNLPDSSGNGMYLIDDDDTRRGPYSSSDVKANHSVRYSPFHSDALMCATCHDVSNPVYSRQTNGTYLLNDLDTPAPDFNPYKMFPIERTFSEWMMSAYNTPSGIPSPQFGGNKANVATCQDCHMRAETGTACNKNVRIRDSLAIHDLTGGNTFIPSVLPGLFGTEVNSSALQAGVVRTTYLLQNATTMEIDGDPVRLSDDSLQIKIKLTNNTGHKLPSGYPEGRRMWLNIKAYDVDDNLIFESGAYDDANGILTHDYQAKIYEIKPGLSKSAADATGKSPGPSFHFVLNDTIYKDNRIPPRGFTNANFEYIQSPTVGYNYSDGQYWDVTTYKIDPNTARFTATLYYQTVSKEYIDFLNSNNVTDSHGTTIYNLWNNNGKSAPIAMNTVNGTISNPLPVELTVFTAKQLGTSIHLHWNTATEINNYGFDIERKVDFGEWTSIGFIKGNGNSNIAKQYSYVDDKLFGGSQFSYRLRQIDNDGQYKYSYTIAVSVLPSQIDLEQNFPNPFNPTTKIIFSIPQKSIVSLKVYDPLGNEVANLVNVEMEAGRYETSFDASLLPSGVYFYKLTAGNFIETKKMLLLK